MDKILIRMAKELLNIEMDLPYRFKNSDTKISDFILYNFDQTWESTALGFGGAGGDVITLARTYVFVPLSVDENCFIYFAGRFAYEVPYSYILMEDVNNCRIESKIRMEKYIK